MSACSGDCGGACCHDARPACGCCDGVHASTPVPLFNRPGLDALAYRTGTHGRFLATMLARLSGTAYPALEGLRTRDRGDFSIALLDGWATVADVLTFYQERIANEGYLRTATERRSVLELARLIGYVPRPGLSATAYLAYTVEAGHELTIDAGTIVSSVPVAKELPQTFQTSEPLVASGAFSALLPRRTRPQFVERHAIATLSRLVVSAPPADLRRGDVVQARIPGLSAFAMMAVTGIEADTVRRTATLSVDVSHVVGPVPAPPTGLGSVRQVSATPEDGRTRLGRLVDVLRKPPSIPPASSRQLRRDVGAIYGSQSAAVGQLFNTLVPEVAGVLGSALSGVAEPNPEPVAFARMAVKAALFGHQVQPFPRYRGGAIVGYTDPTFTLITVDPPSGQDGNNEPGPGVPEQFSDPPRYTRSRDVFLDMVYEAIQPGEEVVLVNDAMKEPVTSRTVKAVETRTVTALGQSARVTKLTLDDVWPAAEDASLSEVVRRTRVLARPEPLALADEPIDDVDVANDVIELAELHPGLTPGRYVIVAGERTDSEIGDVQGGAAAGTGVAGAELAMIAAVEQRPARRRDGTPLPGDTVHTFLHLAQALAYRYRRPTVVVHANVVKATHGTPVSEVLGAGDATKMFQRFALKQPPLTYLPAPTALGAVSTLELRINDVRWHEAEDLLDAGPKDRRFVIRTEDDGRASVEFGDGDRGARPPTGAENIRAAYRSGLGKGGNVAAGRITIAVSRPLGVKDVVNPLPASGGADRETRDQARRNAPLAVQALDRLVSVQDYADFARTFAGIGKASAQELSDGRRRLVHVTIAGVDDAPIAPTSDLFRNLRRALLDLGDPFVPLNLAVRSLRVLVVEAGVRIGADYTWDAVEPVLRATMLEAFGAERRELGQDVVEAEVLRVMQSVAGVTSVRLSVLDSLDAARLARPDPAKGLGHRRRVRARLAEPDPARGVLAAELLLLTPVVQDTLILAELP